jgi:hypothetical protein
MTRQELILYKEQLTRALHNPAILSRRELEELEWELKRVIAELDELDKKRGA